MEDNPFAVLGFNQELIKKLSEEQALKIAKAQYRQLAMMYHPDASTGNSRRFREITEAIGRLEGANPLEFADIRKSFLKKKKKAELESEIARLQERRNARQKQLMGYIRAGAFLEDDTIYTIDRVRMCDTAMHNRRKDDEFNLNPAGFYVLTFDENRGLIREYSQGTVSAYPQRRLVGALDECVVRDVFGGLDRLLHSLSAQSGAKRLTTLDSVPAVANLDHIDHHFFARILPYLSPTVEEGAYLFAASREDGLRFSLEGRIVVGGLERFQEEVRYATSDVKDHDGRRIVNYALGRGRAVKSIGGDDIAKFREKYTKGGVVDLSELKQDLLELARDTVAKQRYERAINRMEEFLKETDDDRFEYRGLLALLK